MNKCEALASQRDRSQFEAYSFFILVFDFFERLKSGQAFALNAAIRIGVGNHDFDVLVVGASLAGASFTASFKNSGLRIAIIDKAHFPRRKPCGEGLSRAGLSWLESLGLDISPLKMRNLTGYKVVGTRRSVDLTPWDSSPDENIGMGLGIQRSVLDRAVLDLALQDSSVEPLLGMKVVEIERARGGVSIKHEGGKVSASMLVLAEGGNAGLSRQLGIVERKARIVRYGASLICSCSFPLDQVHVLPRRGYEIYVTPVCNDRLNVSVLGDRDAIRKVCRADSGARLIEEVSSALDLPLRIEEPLMGAGPTFPQRRTPVSGRVILVGDSCECLDPVSGMGMTHAIRSAMLAAEALRASFAGEISFENAATNYANSHQRFVQPLRGYSRMAYLLLGKLQSMSALALAERTGLAALLRESAVGCSEISSFAQVLPTKFLQLVGAR